MQYRSKLQISDVLQSNYFQDSIIVAGKKGLKRLIRWTHIMEVAEISHLLNGNELILSTGIGWGNDAQLTKYFFQQLINKNVSGLCVKLGSYISSVPEEMIKMADKHELPIIILPEKIRFIDVTQDLNGLLTKTQDKMMSNLGAFSNQLNHYLLLPGAFERILNLLQDYAEAQVIYIPKEGESQFYPQIAKQSQITLLNLIDKTQLESGENSPTIANKPIKASGHKFAELFIFSNTRILTDFDFLLLDRTVTALAQNQLRELYVVEKRINQESLWVEKWLNGEHQKEEVERYLFTLDSTLKANGCVVCLCKLGVIDQQEDLTHYSMIFRSVFKRQGFFMLTSFDQNNMILALVNIRENDSWKKRAKQALKQIQNMDLFNEHSSNSIHFSVGNILLSLDHLHESYQNAKKAFSIYSRTGKWDSPFYDDLHVYRLISRLDTDNYLQKLIVEYLEPIIEYDLKNNGQMFETLKVYFDVNGSKTEAAKQLYIARQSMYHRIEKLEELIGDDFMVPKKRLALEFAIYARKLVDIV